MDIIPFDPTHLLELVPQDAQAPDVAALPRGAAEAAAMGPAYTAIDAEGRVLACAGLAEQHGGHATAWALFGSLRTAVRLLGALKAAIEVSDYRRIDMLVRADFEGGCAFARRLGFDEPPCRLRAYGQDGADYLILARITDTSTPPLWPLKDGGEQHQSLPLSPHESGRL